jgi:hypothetical protein
MEKGYNPVVLLPLLFIREEKPQTLQWVMFSLFQSSHALDTWKED